MRRVLVVVLLLLAACGDDDDAGDNVVDTTTSTTASTTTTSESTTSTTAFDGSTSPTSAPGTTAGVALLIGVTVGDGEVTFTFRDGEVPGFDVGFTTPPIRQDGSGNEIAVDGEAFLRIRMEPASGVDLSGGDFEETYTGPDRIPGQSPIVEVVKTGDFEANLTWVIGLDAERAYRVETGDSMVRVYIAR